MLRTEIRACRRSPRPSSVAATAMLTAISTHVSYLPFPFPAPSPYPPFPPLPPAPPPTPEPEPQPEPAPPSEVDMAQALHLWQGVLRPAGPGECVVLSPGERHMAAGFVAADARWQYIARHCWLRRILAGYLDCLPEQVPLVQGPHGKPNVAGRNDLQFNLTHSGAHTVLAIARSRSVAALGVDLEPVRAHEWASELVAAMFHERERHHWQRLPSTKPELRTRAFAVWWTAKEAWLKALGVGLLVGLDPFDATELAWAPNDRWLPVSITNEGDPHAAAAIRWHVRLFTPFRGYLGTLACGMTVSEVAPEGDTCDRTSSARVVEFVGRRCAVSLCATGTAGAESGETPANPGSSRPTLPCAGRCRAHGSTSFPVHPSGLAMGGQQSRSMARTPAVPSPSADLVAVA